MIKIKRNLKSQMVIKEEQHIMVNVHHVLLQKHLQNKKNNIIHQKRKQKLKMKKNYKKK